MNKFKNKKFIKFILVGVINTLNYYIIYLFFLHVLNQNYLISHIFGFIISFIISFFLTSYIVYKIKPNLKNFLKFPLTQVANISIQTFMLYLCVDILNINKNLAPFISLIITVPVTFLISNMIFKGEENEKN